MCLLSSRSPEQVECLILQEGDLCVGRNHCDSALPLWLPLWYWSTLFIFATAVAVRSFNTQYSPSMGWLWNLLVLPSSDGILQDLGLDGSPLYVCVTISIIAALVHAGHTVKRVMWFRVSAEGRREFVHHSDPNQVSLSYRGRARYENNPFYFSFYHCWILKLATENTNISTERNCACQLHRGQLLRLLGADTGREAEWCRGLSLQVWDRPAARSMDVP